MTISPSPYRISPGTSGSRCSSSASSDWRRGACRVPPPGRRGVLGELAPDDLVCSGASELVWS
ncbi:hypothetical protein [Roseovarius dicentrarchi]|uniref:hypothetical protein n=1 Tax=Roseovarius dicentrarchi TaxID=2250573 RepID=UPI000DEB3161|nr:hypothetical protein [Roseovarius dicentrarchi]